MRGVRGWLVACAALLMTACASSDDDTGVLLDFMSVRRSALIDGMQVDDAFVFITDYKTLQTLGPLTVDQDLQFDIDLPVGSRIGIEAFTCHNVGPVCIANYWGKLETTLSRTTPVAVDIYPAGELLVLATRYTDLLPVPNVPVTLTPARPRPGLASFTVQTGTTVRLPVDTYTVSAGALSDGSALATTGTITVGQGASVESTLFFGACLDVDGDRFECANDCDETSPRCYGADGCTTDVDADGTPDCKDDCIDADHDGYGVGSLCLGPDCDDTRANINPRMPELCADRIDNNCNQAVDEAGCIAAPVTCTGTQLRTPGRTTVLATAIDECTAVAE